MKTRLERIIEARDVSLYKTILRVIGDYCKNVPCTGVDGMFDSLVKGA